MLNNRRFLSLLCLGATFALPACSSTQEEVVDVKTPEVQRYYDLTSDASYGAGIVDPLVMTSLSSDPSVEVYPLDGPAVLRERYMPDRAPNIRPRSYMGDTSVEVFPFGDRNVLPPVQAGIERSNLGFEPHMMPEPAPYSSSYASTSDLVGKRPPVSESQPPETPNYVAIATPGEPLVRIYFDHDAVKLGPDDIDQIMSVTARFNPNDERSILSVEGHASVESSEKDPVKRRAKNMKVSMDRAYSVAKALMEAGIPAEKIRAVSWGEGRFGQALDGRSPNNAARRVDVFQAN